MHLSAMILFWFCYMFLCLFSLFLPLPFSVLFLRVTCEAGIVAGFSCGSTPASTQLINLTAKDWSLLHCSAGLLNFVWHPVFLVTLAAFVSSGSEFSMSSAFMFCPGIHPLLTSSHSTSHLPASTVWFCVLLDYTPFIYIYMCLSQLWSPNQNQK